MIRIIFDNGDIVDCENINKIYIEEIDEDRITIVGNISQLEEDDQNERLP